MVLQPPMPEVKNDEALDASDPSSNATAPSQTEALSQIDVNQLTFISEQDGYRYYEDSNTKAQYSTDAAGYWYFFNQEQGAFQALSTEPSSANNESTVSKKLKGKSKRYVNCGLPLGEDGYPIFPTNDNGLPVLPSDENGQPFFPLDDHGIPIFPWDSPKKTYAFPVDDTEEPIFPRNSQNKPIVPEDKDGKPIFPVDGHGSFIFPLDETNCPIPALTMSGKSVVPKDEFGNFVIPKDREGKPLIQIASDGETAFSMVEWKQWKKYYKEHGRTLYHQQQLANAGSLSGNNPAVGNVAYSINSIFHPLNLEQHSASLEVPYELLQRGRRVRPEDIDLPYMETNKDYASANQANSEAGVGTQKEENVAEYEKQQRRKGWLAEQLRFAKKAGLPGKKSIDGAKDENDESKNPEDVDKSSPDEKIRREKEKNSSGKSYRKDGSKRKSDKKKKRRKRARSSSTTSYESIIREQNSPKRSNKRRKTGSKHKRSKRQRSVTPLSPRSSVSTNTYGSSDNNEVSKGHSDFFDYYEISPGLMKDEFESAVNRLRKKHDREDPSDDYRTKKPKRGDGVINDDGPVLDLASDMSVSDVGSAIVVGRGDDNGGATAAVASFDEKEIRHERAEIFENLQLSGQKSGEIGATAFSSKIEMHSSGERQDHPPSPTPVPRIESPPGKIDTAGAIASDDLATIKLCIQQTRAKYDRLSVRIAELEVEKSIEKRNLTLLRETAKRIRYQDEGDDCFSTSGTGSV